MTRALTLALTAAALSWAAYPVRSTDGGGSGCRRADPAAGLCDDGVGGREGRYRRATSSR